MSELASRIDTAALKCANPVEHVAARYGIDLRPQGQALIGRCPFHRDGGRPNLHIYRQSRSWRCFRGGLGGDVLTLVELIDNGPVLAALLPWLQEQVGAGVDRPGRGEHGDH